MFFSLILSGFFVNRGVWEGARTRLWDVLEKRSVTLIDVHDSDKYDSGHIPGSANIYVGNIDAEARNILGGSPVVVTCGWGGRGILAASILRRRGIRDVFNLLGGVNAWRPRLPHREGITRIRVKFHDDREKNK